MRQLGEQWIEELDGKMHMVKAVKPVELCQGCCFNCNQGGCCWKGFDDCQMGSFFIIKDLGILNEDGLLPCPFCEEYPNVKQSQTTISYVTCITCGCGCEIEHQSQTRGKQQAIDAWNRRAM